MLRTESRNEGAVMSKVTVVGGGLGTWDKMPSTWVSGEEEEHWERHFLIHT